MPPVCASARHSGSSSVAAIHLFSASRTAAARGHDVAVRLIVQGLRRRLGQVGRAEKVGAPTAWLESIAPGVRTARGQAALTRLAAIATRPAAADEVLEAADDVETLWEELKP